MNYRVWIEPDALTEARTTPGNVRQRIKRAMLALGEAPRPPRSRSLAWPPEDFKPRRLKIGKWLSSTLTL